MASDRRRVHNPVNLNNFVDDLMPRTGNFGPLWTA
jgi:hypothetical protein